MVAAFPLDISAFLSLSWLTWSLFSSLEFPGRSHKSRWSWLNWHLSGPRSTALSDYYLSTFICTTTYYGVFPNAFSSLDALLLVNGALSPTQKLKSLPPTIIFIYILNNYYINYDIIMIQPRSELENLEPLPSPVLWMVQVFKPWYR